MKWMWFLRGMVCAFCLVIIIEVIICWIVVKSPDIEIICEQYYQFVRFP